MSHSPKRLNKVPPASMLGALDGRRVLIVHDNGFQGQYLADVVAGSGAMVLGPTASADIALASVENEHPLSALVLSSAVLGTQAIARAALSRGIPVVCVQPASEAPMVPVLAGAVLTTPFGGFQVVDALADVLRDPDCVAGPRSGEH